MGKARNRNAQRSINLLEEALTSLLATKPYEKITVSDITRKADLNRGTFYAHFSSIDDLMRQTMDDLTDKISSSFGSVLNETFLDDPMPLLAKIGDVMTESPELTKKLVDSDRLEPFFTALFGRVTELLHERVRQAYPDAGTFPLKMVDFLVGGIVHVYHCWLVGDYGMESIEQVNEHLCSLVRATGAVVESFGQAADPAGEDGGGREVAGTALIPDMCDAS